MQSMRFCGLHRCAFVVGIDALLWSESMRFCEPKFTRFKLLVLTFLLQTLFLLCRNKSTRRFGLIFFLSRTSQLGMQLTRLCGPHRCAFLDIIDALFSSSSMRFVEGIDAFLCREGCAFVVGKDALSWSETMRFCGRN